MKQFIRTYWKTLLFFAAAGLIGGFFTGIYLMDIYPAEIQEQILAQGLNSTLLGLVTAVQSAGYGVVLGALGIFFGSRTGLFKNERTIEKTPLAAALLVSLFGGLTLILSDILFFGRYSQVIMDSYAAKPSFAFLIGCVTYGAVIEEVMLRLFLMSLIAFILHKLFDRASKTPRTRVLIAANVIAAALFAAGHLPSTFMLLGNSPVILLRCFLLNGGIGLLLGWLYRKHGLRYAMIAHGGCHVVSKLIWILFI